MNYGDVLIIWDRQFGMFQEKTTEKTAVWWTRIFCSMHVIMVAMNRLTVANDQSRIYKPSTTVRSGDAC